MLENKCPEGWRMVKLGDLGEVNRGRSRHRPRYAEHLYGGPHPFIQTGDVKLSDGRITKYQQTYSQAGLSQSRMWPAGTMCITIAANIAETGILSFPACFPDSVVGFIADDSRCDVYFIEYIFRYLKRRIQHEATGSVQDNINLGTLARLYFPIPPLPEQSAIAHILGTLDDKIELNRRINETLEGIARALFKSWFVDFDPVRAKAEGRQPVGMDAETAALFPDSLEESELGLIPAGWEVKAFTDTFDVISGGTPKTSIADYWDGDIPWFSVVDSPPHGQVFVLDTEKHVTALGIANSAAKVLPVNSTILTARGTVGNLAIIAVPMAMNQSCYALQSKSGNQPAMTYYSASEIVSTLKQWAYGSVFSTITTATLGGMRIVVPPIALPELFEKLVGPLMSRIKSNRMESRTLSDIRDSLLPKLISGELRVPDSEKLIAASPI